MPRKNIVNWQFYIIRKELIYKKSVNAQQVLETFHADLWTPANSYPTLTKGKYILVIGKYFFYKINIQNTFDEISQKKSF